MTSNIIYRAETVKMCMHVEMLPVYLPLVPLLATHPSPPLPPHPLFTHNPHAMTSAMMGAVPTRSNCTASCDTLLVLKYPASDNRVGLSNLRDSESASAPEMGPAIEIPLVVPACKGQQICSHKVEIMG